MGRESKKQIVQIEALRSVTQMVREALARLDNAIETAERNSIADVEVRQLPKGKRAVVDLLDFAHLLNVSIIGSLLPTEKPTSSAVIYGEQEPHPLKIAEKKRSDSKQPKKPE